MILHRNETGPSVEIGQIKRFGELPCEHGRGADITNFAGFDDVVQRLQRFFDRRVVIPSMDLVKIYVIGP